MTVCGYGGIGRRARFRSWSERVQVRVLLSAVYGSLVRTGGVSCPFLIEKQSRMK